VDVATTVELVAQAAAAWLALRDAARGEDGELEPELMPVGVARPEPGMLVGVHAARFLAPHLGVGERLEITVRESWSRGPLVQVSGRVLRPADAGAAEGARLVAEAEVQLLHGGAAAQALAASPGPGSGLAPGEQ